jgi:hypothetical protein
VPLTAQRLAITVDAPNGKQCCLFSAYTYQVLHTAQEDHLGITGASYKDVWEEIDADVANYVKPCHGVN